MKYRAYKVSNAGHLRTLEVVVNRSLAEGWIPLGGIYSVPKDEVTEPVFEMTPEGDGLRPSGTELKTSTNWCQAMVLPYEDA